MTLHTLAFRIVTHHYLIPKRKSVAVYATLLRLGLEGPLNKDGIIRINGNDAKIGWFMIRVNDQNRIILVICFS